MRFTFVAAGLFRNAMIDAYGLAVETLTLPSEVNSLIPRTGLSPVLTLVSQATATLSVLFLG